MSNRIALISNDKDFFDYIKPLLSLRKCDEIFSFTFASVLKKLKYLKNAVIIINSEGAKDRTLDFLKILSNNPIIVSSFNSDNDYDMQCMQNGALALINLLSESDEINAKLKLAQKHTEFLDKILRYENILVKNNIFSSNNGVLKKYDEILDETLQNIYDKSIKAVFVAISPSNTAKFLLKPEAIESIILDNIRQSDLLMNYAPNKYFLLLFNTDIDNASKIWNKIKTNLPEEIYAGFSAITNQKRQQLINEVLNKLHEAINNKVDITEQKIDSIENLNIGLNDLGGYSNFKLFKQDFEKKFEQIVAPAFYQIAQKYKDLLRGVAITQNCSAALGIFNIKTKSSTFCFKISGSGYSKFLVDVSITKTNGEVDSKRINLEIEELESGLIEDMLEQFIAEYKKEIDYDNI